MTHRILVLLFGVLFLAVAGCPPPEPEDDDDATADDDDATADDDDATADDDDATADDDDATTDDDDATGDDDSTGDDDATGDDDDATGDDDTTGDDDDSTGGVDADGDGWDAGVDCDDNDPALNLDDADGDGHDTCSGDCDDAEPAVNPGAVETDCDYLDNDCNGSLHANEVDNDGDGHDECEGDCDDGDGATYPGAPEACDGADQDCDGVADNDCVATVFDIQGGGVPDGSAVSLDGVVVTTSVTEPFSYCSRRGFWVQEPGGGEYSGIFVLFEVAALPGFTVTPGDVVDLSGTYSEYYDLSEIQLADAADLTVISSGPAPAAHTIPDVCAVVDWEPWEGVYVTLENLTVSATITDIGYGQFEVDGCLLVDSLFFEYTDCGVQDLTPDPPFHQAITSITGPLNYGFSEYKIEPTGPGAFVGWTP